MTLQAQTVLAVDWNDGTVAHQLLSENAESTTSEPTLLGAGIDGAGNVYAYWSGVSTSPESMAFRTPSTEFSWTDIPASDPTACPEWGAGSASIDPSAAGAYLFASGGDWVLSATGAFGGEVFSPPSSCLLASSAAGIPALATFPWITLSPWTSGDCAIGSNPGLRMCHVAAKAMSCSPLASGLPASGAGALYWSDDGGATWSRVSFPETTVTDVEGLVFDAAGTLFSARAGKLFSLATP